MATVIDTSGEFVVFFLKRILLKLLYESVVF